MKSCRKKVSRRLKVKAILHPPMPTQPEQVLEDNLIAQMIGQHYELVAVTDEASMLANLKAQMEVFNGLTLTAGEFTKVLNHLNRKAGVFEKAKTLRDRMKLYREDGHSTARSKAFLLKSATPKPSRKGCSSRCLCDNTGDF
jgi:hypothetical protein